MFKYLIACLILLTAAIFAQPSALIGFIRTEWTVNSQTWDPPYLTTRLTGESDLVWLSRHIREVEDYMQENAAEPDLSTYIITCWSSQADPYCEQTLTTGNLGDDLKNNEDQVEAAFGQHPPD